MNPRDSVVAHWATASAADVNDSLPAELTALGTHVKRCHRSRERWFSLLCVVDTGHDFIAGHFVTTIVVATLFLGILATTV